MLFTTYVVHYPKLSYISGQELVSKDDFLISKASQSHIQQNLIEGA